MSEQHIFEVQFRLTVWRVLGWRTAEAGLTAKGALEAYDRWNNPVFWQEARIRRWNHKKKGQHAK